MAMADGIGIAISILECESIARNMYFTKLYKVGRDAMATYINFLCFVM